MCQMSRKAAATVGCRSRPHEVTLPRAISEQPLTHLDSPRHQTEEPSARSIRSLFRIPGTRQQNGTSWLMRSNKAPLRVG